MKYNYIEYINIIIFTTSFTQMATRAKANQAKQAGKRVREIDDDKILNTLQIGLDIKELYSRLLSITSIMENGQKFISLLQQSKPTDSNKKHQELQLMKDLDLSEEEQLEIQSIIAERNRLEQQLDPDV